MSDRASSKPTRSWRALATTALVVALVASFAPFARVAPAAADVSFDQRMLELVNAARAANGVAPVQWSAPLGSVAGNGAYGGCGPTIYGRAHDMGLRHYFSHTILNCNQNVGSMVVAAGVSASAMGENIAWASGQGTDPAAAAQVLHNSLMASPGHRANILNATFTHVGIGSWRSAPGQTWSGSGSPQPNVWIAAQVFARLAVASAPVLSVTPPALSFSSALNVATPPQTLTLKNTGTSRMAITGTLLSGSHPGDFALGTNRCLLTTLAPGSSCTIDATFTPKAAGSRGATLSIMGDAPGTVALTGTGVAAAPPGAPTAVVATGGDGQLSVTWAPPVGGGAVELSAVWVYDAAGYVDRYVTVCATCTTATVAGLANGKAYYVVVAAFNPAGWGAAAWSGWTTVAAQASVPTDIRVTSQPGQVTATWKPPANAAAAAVDSYIVAIYDLNGYSGRHVVVCATCTTATVGGLANGTWSRAVVYAHNPRIWGEAGISDWLVVGAPSAPRTLAATGGPGQVTTTWSPPASDSGSPVTAYLLMAYDANGYAGQYAHCAATCRSGVVTGLTNGRQYTIVVHAGNQYGWGTAAFAPVATPTG